jgi:hypothetical protein
MLEECASAPSSKKTLQAKIAPGKTASLPGPRTISTISFAPLSAGEMIQTFGHLNISVGWPAAKEAQKSQRNFG